MSINVTVSGNPIRITRGKMVTHDPTKTEFERRRLIRLEQVRQQSKDIAERKRNKLKKEKSKTLSEAEKQGEIQVKYWQARKLLELQNQSQEGVGLGYIQAVREEEEEQILADERELEDRVARERGRLAGEKLQIEKNEESLKRAVPVQRKKITRGLEDFRAKKSKTPTKKSAGKQLKEIDDSDSENVVPELEGLEDSSTKSCTSLESAGMKNRGGVTVVKTSKQQQTSNGVTVDKEAQTTPRDIILTNQNPNFAMDTRISERIKRRTKLNPEPDYANTTHVDVRNQLNLCDCCKCPLQHQQQQQQQQKRESLKKGSGTASKPVEDLQPILADRPSDETKSGGVKPDEKFSQGDKSSKAGFSSGELPIKPKVTLRSLKDRPVRIDTAGPLQPVKYYDHPNRFSKNYIPEKSYVTKLDDDSIIVSPNVLNEDELKEQMRKRDIEAHARGQAALEKERNQREYKELVKKLPVLQKQERIYEIGMDKEKYHMSRDRMEEFERRRQNRLDNAYEELFVRRKPDIVTLPRQKREPPILNNANWDTDKYPKDSRTGELTQLLSSLRNEKDSLMKEIEKKLSKETLDKLAKSSSGDIKSKSTDYPRTKRKRSRESRLSPPTSSTSSSSELSVKTKSSQKGTLASSITSPSPHKKLKTSRKVLILQNTSTQTTPKGVQSAATSPAIYEACTCPRNKDTSNLDMCEIVIKIKEDEKPEVTVNPPLKGGKTVKVITERKDATPDDEIDKPKKTSPRPKIKKVKGPSWRESFSQTASSQSTSSTSYLDPPNRVLKNQSVNNSTSSSKSPSRLDPRLLTYIRKLLNMSRANIDDLAVSASDVSTPGTSIVDTPSNNPLNQLVNVMKHFNLDAAELRKQLSYASEDNSIHYNTSVTVSSGGISDVEKSNFKSRTAVVDGGLKTVDETKKKLIQYADIAASCTQKISSLTAMIEQVRAEKNKIMQSPPSSDDLTKTSYKELPHKDKDKSESSSSSELDEFEKRFLEIDYEYAEKLKKLSVEELEKLKSEEQCPTDQELLLRLKTLLYDCGKQKKKSPVKDLNVRETISVDVSQCKEEGDVPPPIFLDIPKLPPLEAASLDADNKKKRPPPSKGLRAIATPQIPHELSTIIEADSQVSTKLDSPSKPKSVKSNVDESLKEVNTNTSSDVSEMETMETMLVSIGMEWAIPTLKKTREAFAMASSSSGSKDSKDSGELSLREFLSKISDSSSHMSLSDSQGVSLIQVDNRRTSTPIIENKDVKESGRQLVFPADSDLSSVRDQSEKFYDFNEESNSKLA